MAQAEKAGKQPRPVVYDGDQKLLAFLGAAAFVMGAASWMLFALRWFGTQVGWLGWGLSLASVVAFVLAWGLCVKMDRGAPLTRWDVRRLFLAALPLGMVVGAVPYFLLRLKLEDPDFLHLASEPENVPPAWR